MTPAAEILDNRTPINAEVMARLDAEDVEWLADFLPAIRWIQQGL